MKYARDYHYQIRLTSSIKLLFIEENEITDDRGGDIVYGSQVRTIQQSSQHGWIDDDR